MPAKRSRREEARDLRVSDPKIPRPRIRIPNPTLRIPNLIPFSFCSAIHILYVYSYLLSLRIDSRKWWRLQEKTLSVQNCEMAIARTLSLQCHVGRAVLAAERRMQTVNLSKGFKSFGGTHRTGVENMV